MVTSIYQEVELSLTNDLIPQTVHVKQFDNRARKIRCILFDNAVQYAVPKDCIAAYTGTRPDGTIFHYTSETAQELVSIQDGTIIFTITAYMTEQSGRYPVDILLLSTEGDVLGSFSLTLNIEKAAIANRKIATFTYASVVDAIRQGILEICITDDGYFSVISNDGLGLGESSESSTIDEFNKNLMNCSITESGYLSFSTEDGLKLVVSVTETGRLCVEYGCGE